MYAAVKVIAILISDLELELELDNYSIPKALCGVLSSYTIQMETAIAHPSSSQPVTIEVG